MTQRTAIVTGAARGIGAAVAKRLAADGMKVAVLDRESMHEGARLNHIAMREFVTRTASGDWSCPEPHQITVSIFERPDQEVTSDESAA